MKAHCSAFVTCSRKKDKLWDRVDVYFTLHWHTYVPPVPLAVGNLCRAVTGGACIKIILRIKIAKAISWLESTEEGMHDADRFVRSSHQGPRDGP